MISAMDLIAILSLVATVFALGYSIGSNHSQNKPPES